MTRRLPLRLPLLALLLAACTAAPPVTPAPTPAGTPAATPTGEIATPSPAASPTGPPTPSPSSPVASPSVAPTVTPFPTPTGTLPPGTPDAATLARLEAALEAERISRRIPGLAAVIIFPDGSRWSAAGGEADIDPARPASADTPFVVGSITKTFVTALVMQLAEEGRLSLDDRLSRWLPDYPRARRITLRHLLNHTSGVFNYFEHPDYIGAVFNEPGHAWTPDEILERFETPPYFEPGQGYHYSNTGFVLLGLVVEEVTGRSLGDELQRRFFTPLGMLDTYFQGEGPPPADSAQGYLRSGSGHREIGDDSGYRPTRSAATAAWAAGAIVSSAHDIATWGRALYGGQLLEPESVAEMTDFEATPFAGGTYGLGTRTRLFQGRRAAGHTGSLRGFMAAMWHMPAENVTIVVLTNLGRIDANPIVGRLAGVFVPFADPAGVPGFEPGLTLPPDYPSSTPASPLPAASP